MKKANVFIILCFIIILSGCQLTNPFDQYYRLALQAIANGVDEAALDYAEKLSEWVTTPDQRAISCMINGYAYFIAENYNMALLEFDSSDDISQTSESIAGLIMTYFMVEQFELINFQLDQLSAFHENWAMKVNNQELSKTGLYTICALSSAIQNDKDIFDSIKSKISHEKAQEMEAFFFD
ncbi:MAG TPA: hypothetical protein P5107_01395 [Thermotogota bacterium]|nr:hypothetical protein [Thermotogota bacterium]